MSFLLKIHLSFLPCFGDGFLSWVSKSLTLKFILWPSNCAIHNSMNVSIPISMALSQVIMSPNSINCSGEIHVASSFPPSAFYSQGQTLYLLPLSYSTSVCSSSFAPMLPLNTAQGMAGNGTVDWRGYWPSSSLELKGTGGRWAHLSPRQPGTQSLPWLQASAFSPCRFPGVAAQMTHVKP